MKTTASALIIAALGASAWAAEVVSKDFKLVVINADGKYNGSALTACHTGAAIESLCISKTDNIEYKEYNFKHDTSEVTTKGLGAPGLLRYKFGYTGDNGTEYEQQPMTLFIDPSTNVALPLFEPTSSGTEVAFDSEGRMNIQSYLNDTVDPPTDSTNAAYYRWYVCSSNFEGYVYNTLNWVYGKYEPENPTCVKYTVKRVYV